jgi:hypothetical protein
MIGYIYLLQEREFIKTKENIYKLGKTKQENLKRLKQYSKGSELIIQLQCENFEGDKYKMQEIIYNHIINCKKVIIDCYSSDEEYMDID